METFVIGDIVTIKPEWLDAGESADTEYMIVDVNYDTKRCYIEPVKCDLPLKPQNLALFDMLILKKESEAVSIVKKQQKACGIDSKEA